MRSFATPKTPVDADQCRLLHRRARLIKGWPVRERGTDETSFSLVSDYGRSSYRHYRICRHCAGRPELRLWLGFAGNLPDIRRLPWDKRNCQRQTHERLLRHPANTGCVLRGGVSRSGGCLLFRFKVEGETSVFTARWCDSYGIVPWQGRTIRASVSRISREAPPVQQKRNLNVR
jgi:hypothetical protein